MLWGQVDTVSSVMEAPGDKMATTHAEPPIKVPYPSAPKRGKHGKPAATVKFGSASVPVYRCDSGGRGRFAISHYRDGKRLRQFFTTLEAAKKEAQFVAQRIQSGMQHVTDLKPHERDSFKAAEAMLQKTGIPLSQYLVRPARAPTRHQTQNPGLGNLSSNPEMIMVGKCGAHAQINMKKPPSACRSAPGPSTTGWASD